MSFHHRLHDTENGEIRPTPKVTVLVLEGQNFLPVRGNWAQIQIWYHIQLEAVKWKILPLADLGIS